MTVALDSTSGDVLNDRGMRFDRRNTREGVDPFDMFLWSTRDVVMRNWRDGSVNFEQLGVEFPTHWSDNAVSIVTSKYFRGALGSSVRETSLRQVIGRVVDSYVAEGLRHGYFASPKDASVFGDELKFALADQQFSFNSPVWFNVGTPSPWQVSACYILSVDDSMESILNWYQEEGMIFKGGSGAGVNLSSIRSSKELLSSGGNASGPVSFMRGADASAGTIKSGGATRRAAKMVILDVDHPDVAEFVRTKADEERKIRVLRDAGFDMDLGGRDIVSVQYQNANNSVRVSDEFMNAVESGGSFALRARTDGSVVEEVDARGLLRDIAVAAWECADPGIQYDGAIQRWHTLPNEGRISATNPCSEFVHLDNSSCNLASIKLTKFFNSVDGSFDIEGYRYLVRLLMTAAEISVAFGHFPTEKIGEVTRKSRPIGLGYTDLGAMLMRAAVPYDSAEGRAWASAVTSLLTAEAYLTSAELSRAVGPFEYFDANRDEMLNVIRMHGDASMEALTSAAGLTSAAAAPAVEVQAAAERTWQEALSLGSAVGFRNSQAVVIAPTGTISFFMDATTTGIEPDFSLVKFKKIADGSSVTMVNEEVPAALRRLGYSESDVEAISEFIARTGSVDGAPGFDPEHASVFACAVGSNAIDPMGHVRMMAAVQPFVSGAISKTVNMPEDSTVEDIENVYLEGWRMGLKCVAVYRDNCKVGQPLSASGSANESADESAAPDAAEVAASPAVVAAASGMLSVIQGALAPPAPVRHRLPRQRQAVTTSFTVGGADGYITAGAFEDGRLGELFFKMSKPGSTLAGVMDALAISVSLGLQYGVPLEMYCAKFLNMKFEPAGLTNDPDVRFASSVLDYVFRRLAIDFLPEDVRAQLGVLTTAERSASVEGTYGSGTATSALAAEPEAVVVDAESAVDLVSASVAPAVVAAPVEVEESLSVEASDHLRRSLTEASSAPLCFSCGVEMVRAGSCHCCPQCGTTSGCS